MTCGHMYNHVLKNKQIFWVFELYLFCTKQNTFLSRSNVFFVLFFCNRAQISLHRISHASQRAMLFIQCLVTLSALTCQSIALVIFAQFGLSSNHNHMWCVICCFNVSLVVQSSHWANGQGRINARAYLGLSPGPRTEGGPRWCRKIL